MSGIAHYGRIAFYSTFLASHEAQKDPRFRCGSLPPESGGRSRSASVAKETGHFFPGRTRRSRFFIQKGRVRISAVSTNGKEATLALMGAGDFVGEECVASSHTLRLTTATAISEGSMLAIQKSTMITQLKTEHRFSEMFVSFLLSRNARFQEALADQLFNSSEKRLARVLLQLAQFGKEGTPETIVPKIPRRCWQRWSAPPGHG
jgi:CRP/FNR family transcriptional regulator, cyclic AMP receptor protein